MIIKNALFVGMYPNAINTYRNVFFQNLIFAIADLGIDCTVISPVPVTKYLFKTKDIEHHTIHVTPKGSQVTVYYPRYVSLSSKQLGSFNTEVLSEKLFENSVLKVVKRLDKQYDFVYGHFFLYGGLAAVSVGRSLNIPSFIAYGECDFETQIKNTYGIPTRKELEGLTGIISVSKKNTNELRNLGIVQDVPIVTAPNSTDLSLFYHKDKNTCRERFGLPKDLFIVGFVGGFVDRKGDKRLLAATKDLDDVYLAFAGKGDNPPQGERVIFCKSLCHDEICDFLNALDVFCLPTLSEGFCNSIVEAAACGVPIISSNLPFNDEILDNTNSIRVNPLSEEEIKTAILRLKQDDDLRTKMQQLLIEKAQSFSINNRASTILGFIKNCID